MKYYFGFPEDKRIRVSDWSQPFKIAIFCAFGIVALYGVARIINLLEQIVINTSK